MTAILFNYDILEVSCDKCENWVQLSGAEPRRRAEGCGFRFNSGTPQEDFTCLACNCPAQDSYHVIAIHVEDGDHELRDVTAAIHTALGRHKRE
ncbi:hypothetical protein [Henriciella sp.]|uniref:hypothetical protein n=1 Tax=Henriciella sp. TaxID=1968823 RepID=UPI000C0D94ED|nr:hypothetical protein [Henriciella sp.]PHR80836.1 MAG: hypothetical protein COA64_03350 [Henriciella sp.]